MQEKNAIISFRTLDKIKNFVYNRYRDNMP